MCLKINDCVVKTEVPLLIVRITSINWSQMRDKVYPQKNVMIREYRLEDDTGNIHLTTFNAELPKKVGDFVTLRRCWCREDKLFGRSLTLGKYGNYE